MTSIISTVKNEIEQIEDFLHALSVQKEVGELVIVDGGSTDGTIEAIRRFIKIAPFKVVFIVKPNANIAKGRNIAISQAKGDIIAVTDAGCEVSKDWLEQITKPLRENADVGVVSGCFKVDRSSFSHNVLSAVTIPPLYEIEEGRFLPSSRSVAFRKSVWEKVSTYPEWLPICEDVVFDLTLKRAGVSFCLNSEALVIWFVRDTWVKYFWQYYRYARGDGHAKLWPRRHIIRYGTYFMAIILLTLTVFVSQYAAVVLVIGFFVYMSKFWRRFFYHYPKERWWVYAAACAAVPFLVIVGDVAKMIGYVVGRWQRYKGVIRAEKF